MGKALTKSDKKNYITTLTTYSEELVAKGEESFEVYITSQIAEGIPLLDICRKLNFPAVHILSWLQKEHGDLLIASQALNKDKQYANLAKSTDVYDDVNYKHRKAASDIKLNVLKAREITSPKEQVVATGGGMNFAINVVVPDYTKQDEVIEAEVIEVIEEDNNADG